MESQRLLLGVIVFGIIFFTLLFSKPNITGFVPAETFSQKLNIDVLSSQRFVLSSEDVLSLSSLSMSGAVSGSGLVNVYLADGSAKWLVFSNKKKKSSSLEHITGLAVGDLNIAPGEKLNRIESLPDGYITRDGSFSNECVETCVLDPGLFSTSSLFLDVIVEPGTSFHVSEIRFSLVE